MAILISRKDDPSFKSKVIGQMMASMFRRAAAILLISLHVPGQAALAQDSQSTPSELSETYGSWIVKCQSRLIAEKPQQKMLCEMVQELFQRDTGQRVLALSVQTDADNALITLVAPFGLLLAAGIEVSVSGQPLFKSDFSTCLPAGCIAAAPLKLSEMETISSYSELSVKMVTADNQEIVATVPLEGFAGALNRLRTF